MFNGTPEELQNLFTKKLAEAWQNEYDLGDEIVSLNAKLEAVSADLESTQVRLKQLDLERIKDMDQSRSDAKEYSNRYADQESEIRKLKTQVSELEQKLIRRNEAFTEKSLIRQLEVENTTLRNAGLAQEERIKELLANPPHVVTHTTKVGENPFEAPSSIEPDPYW